MRDECDENPTVNSMPRGLKYSAGHDHDGDLDSVALNANWRKSIGTG